MSNSKLGWCEGCCASGNMKKVEKTILKGRKAYKYYRFNSKGKDVGNLFVGKQIKKEDGLGIKRNKMFKADTNKNIRAHERALEHDVLFAMDKADIDFIEVDKRFSDMYHFD